MESQSFYDHCCRAIGLQGYSVVNNPEQFMLSNAANTSPLCSKIRGLSEGQEKLCMLYTDHMIHVGRGARNGIGECQWQFRKHRWNCTTVQDTTVFGPVLSIRKSFCFLTLKCKVFINLLTTFHRSSNICLVCHGYLICQSQYCNPLLLSTKFNLLPF